MAFSKKCKNMSTKQEICKDGRVTATRCKYYCPLVANLTITNAKSSILNVAEFLDPSLKTSACTKTSPACVKTSLFSYCFEMLLPLSKVLVFFCYFLQYDESVFDSLLDGCYLYLVFMDLVSGC